MSVSACLVPFFLFLPATSAWNMKSFKVLCFGFVILQGTGTRHIGHALTGSNAAETHVRNPVSYMLLQTEGKLYGHSN